MIVSLLRALRPKQWVKNTFCLAPLVFARRALDPSAVLEALYVFVAFSLLASAVYLTNDVIDRERDRAHPVKRNRPVAAGKVGVPVALATAVALCASALGLGAWLSLPVLAVLCGYLVLNIGYTFWLKHVVLVDLFAIAIGFVLRVLAGAEAIEVTTSQWILTCTLFISLLMAASKRRSEVELQGPEKGTRAVLSRYSVRYLDLIITVVAAGAILSYALYAMSPSTAEHLGTTALIYTLPFVIFAVFRYVYLVLDRASGESPFELLVGDAAMVVNVLAFTVVVILLVYVP